MSESNEMKGTNEKQCGEELGVADLEPREEIQGGTTGVHKVPDVTLKRGVID